jgi:hypothetical protein
VCDVRLSWRFRFLMLLHNFFQVTLIWDRALVVLVRFSEMYVALYLIVGDITLLLVAYYVSVILTDKQNHTDLTHWSFFFSAATCFGCLHQPSSGRHQFTIIIIIIIIIINLCCNERSYHAFYTVLESQWWCTHIYFDVIEIRFDKRWNRKQFLCLYRDTFVLLQQLNILWTFLLQGAVNRKHVDCNALNTNIKQDWKPTFLLHNFQVLHVS